MLRNILAGAALVASALSLAAFPAAAQPQITRPQSLPPQVPNAGDATTIILSSDTATISRAAHTLAAQTGTADDLCTVVTTGLVLGHQTILKADAGDTITIKNGGSCNITTDTGADLILSGAGRAFVYVTAAGVDASLGGGSAAAITSLSDLSALTAASPAGTVRTLGAAMRSGAFVRVTDDISPLVAVDTDNCVSYPDPGTPDGSAGGWVRIEYLGGHADINAGWCGFGESGATTLQNANRLQTGINVAAQQVATLVVNKRYAATARVSTPSGSYTMRPGIVVNKHGVTLDLGTTVITAESGVAGALLTNGDTSGSYSATNKAIIQNGTLRGDASANFAFDATAGQIGIKTTNCYFGCEINNVDVELFDTCVFYDGSFGWVQRGVSTFSCGTEDPDTGAQKTGGLVIYSGTASLVEGGRHEYSNGEANIIVDGSLNGGTLSLTINDIICQNARYSCMLLRNVDEVTVNDGDFENNANGIGFDASSGSVVSTASDTLTIPGWIYGDGTAVSYGINGGTAIGGLTDATVYYVRDRSGDTFKLAATSGGAAINLTSLGVGSAHNISPVKAEIDIDRTSAGRNGSITINGTTFIRTGSPDNAKTPVVRAEQFQRLNLINVLARDQVTADYDSLATLEGSYGTYNISGVFIANVSSPAVIDNGTADMDGCIDATRVISGTPNLIRKCEAYERLRADEVFADLFRIPDGGELTVASGAVTVTASRHTIDTEADAATDDLDTLTGGTVGDFLILSSNNSTRDTTVKHNTGNILMDGKVDFTFTSPFDRCLFVRDTSWWINIGCGDNF